MMQFKGWFEARQCIACAPGLVRHPIAAQDMRESGRSPEGLQSPLLLKHLLAGSPALVRFGVGTLSTMHVSPLSWIALSSAAIAAAIAIYYLVWRPPLDARMKALLMFGLGILPIITALVGNLEGFKATEQQQFCGSCHVMGQHIEDANSLESVSLAAIHSRNSKFGGQSCYVCHKNYGMYGYALTKLDGMGHVYMYLTEYWDTPLDEAVEEIRIASPYKNENCMQCHSTGGAIWNDVADHEGLLGDLRSGETSCVSAGCHGYAHPFSKPEDSAAEASSGMPPAGGT